MSTAEILELDPLASRLAVDGKLEAASGKNPFLLADKSSVWYVETGKVELFMVSVDDDGEPTGARAHFATIEQGSAMFGMNLDRYGMGSGFLAVGKLGTNLRRLPVSTLHMYAADRTLAPYVADLIDRWVQTMSVGLTRDITPRPVFQFGLTPGEEAVLDREQRAKAAKGVVWLDVREGDLLYVGMEALVFSGAKVFFPVSSDSWVESSASDGEKTVVYAHGLRSVIVKPAVWWGLELFHEALCQCQFINKKLATVDEFNRLRSKADYAEEAGKGALRDLAAVLDRGIAARTEVLAEVSDDIDAIYSVCERVGRELGMNVVRHPSPRKKASIQERVGEVAKASRFRTRAIVLRGEWWLADQGPLLGLIEGTEDPVALIPDGPRDYRMINPKTGENVKVNQDVASRLGPFGLTFYRPFPDGALSVLDILKFGIRGVGRDLAWVGAAAVAMGILGLLIPYAMGQIFDAAIPQAERGILVQFALALFIAAVVSSAFRIVQSVSVIRIQGKMEYSIQAGMWDRLLNLPMTFFGKYSSGDLADRAAGISEIRDILAGSAVAALLGSISAVFYVGMLFKYSLKMALLAIGLTLAFIAFTTTINLLQLRYQRERMALNGKIGGLVLQLISGVAKIRVSGAENHAFRTWAKDFAEQRRITFTMRNIQNWGEVFNSSFPIFANVAIFYMLFSLQSKGDVAMTTGDFIAFTAAYSLFLVAMLSLSEASMGMLGIVPIYERFKPIITTEAETDESRQYPGEMSGEIELSHIHFRYDEEGPWILSDLSIKIQPGEFVAFVGGSGSGKSTTMRLMLGFEQPQKGTIYYDGQDLNTLDLREVRQQMGVVLQTSRVLPSDIFRNIIGTSSLTVEDAWAAAEAVGLADDIRDMPMGMHTYVAEGGGGFSGGQKQRLLIARAIVHKPKILFLDEATSALDNRTQAIVTESMNRLQATRIVIAHRLSTVIDADRIVVLDRGVIKEIGNYDELMKMNGIFADLARRQIA